MCLQDSMSFGKCSLTEGWSSDVAFYSLSVFPVIMLHAHVLNSDQGGTGSLSDSSIDNGLHIYGSVTVVFVIYCLI